MVPTIARRIVLALAIFGASSIAIAAPTVPTTAEDHFALAKQYQEKAATYRKEANDHREMLEAARKNVTNAHERQGQKSPWLVKMEKHCTAIITAADKLASENEKAAEFHTLRGKELQGK
jgi:hypothetical protein